MRFAKFSFALLFGVVFFITLFKVLFFVLMAALVFGGVFLASRAFGYRRFQHQQWAQQYGATAQQYMPFGSQQSPFEQPLNPNWQKRQSAPAYGRRIEVL
jgi:predicted lipid-binding transport protein (Tim44 family)